MERKQKLIYTLGGIMIWALTQDASDPDKSLLQAIGRAAGMSC